MGFQVCPLKPRKEACYHIVCHITYYSASSKLNSACLLVEYDVRYRTSFGVIVANSKLESPILMYRIAQSSFKVVMSYNSTCAFINCSLQSLNILTQESADDEKAEEDPEIIRYRDRTPSKNMHIQFIN